PNAGTTAVTPETKAPEQKAEAKDDDAEHSDRLHINGVWNVVSRESAGKIEKPSEDDIKNENGKLIINGERFTIVENGTPMEETCKVNPSKSPRQIDLMLNADPDQIPEVGLRGIYSLEKDTLKISFNNPRRDFGIPRPVNFTTNEGHRYPTVVLYKRVSEGD